MTPKEAYRAAEEVIDPWLDFLQAYDGSELGDYAGALRNLIGLAFSAAREEDGCALIQLAAALIRECQADEDGWFSDLVSRAQEDWEATQRKPPSPESPRTERAALPALPAGL